VPGVSRHENPPSGATATPSNTHGAEELPGCCIAAAIDLQLRTDRSNLIDHQRVDRTRTGQPIEASSSDRPIFQSTVPAKSKHQVVEVDRFNAVFDGHLEVVLNAILDGSGTDCQRRSQKHQDRPEDRAEVHHRHSFAVIRSLVPSRRHIPTEYGRSRGAEEQGSKGEI
jgi:hypothetical protein